MAACPSTRPSCLAARAAAPTHSARPAAASGAPTRKTKSTRRACVLLVRPSASNGANQAVLGGLCAVFKACLLHLGAVACVCVSLPCGARCDQQGMRLHRCSTRFRKEAFTCLLPAAGSAWCQTSAPPLFGQGKCLKKGMTAQLRACCKDDDCRSGKCLTITNYQTGKKARICDCIGECCCCRCLLSFFSFCLCCSSCCHLAGVAACAAAAAACLAGKFFHPVLHACV